MKLIKLSSDSSGEFENIFNTDIKVAPFSKIGLLSASVPLSSEVITIDSTNDQFEMQTQANHAFADVVFKEGKYTELSFLTEVQRALNAALNSDVETSCTPQWKTSLATKADSSRYLELQLRRGAYDLDVLPADLSVNKNLTHEVATDSYTKSSVGEDWGAFGVTTGVFNNGSGQLSLSVEATSTKFAVGLLKEPPAASATLLSPSDYDYVVYTVTGTTNYLFQEKGGAVQDLGVAQFANVEIAIELSEGNLNFIAIDDADNQQTMKVISDWTYDTSYHMAFNVGTGVVNTIQWDPDPYYTNVDGALVAMPTHEVLYDATSLGEAPSAGKASITFKTKPRTGTYLGFHDPGYSMNASGLTWDLIAEESLEESVSFTDLLVELPNLPMQSFDGALSKQRPVIAYIPSLEVKNSELVYNAINPVMIDMNNAHAFNLNRVQVRLLTSASNQVNIEAASIVVVLSS